MFLSSGSTLRRIVAAVFAVLLLASCSSSGPTSSARVLDPSLPTAVPDSSAAGDSAASSAGSTDSSSAASVPAVPPSATPVSCSPGDSGDKFSPTFEPVPGASLDLVVEVRDQAGSVGQQDTVRSWPVTVTVSDRIEDEWLMVWEATRSALALPVGFSTSDANALQERGLPPMPPAFYRVDLDGGFVGMEIPDGFGRAVTQSLTDAIAVEADPAAKTALEQIVNLYSTAEPDLFEVALIEAEIFHEFATLTYSDKAKTGAGLAQAAAFLAEPVTTAVTTHLDASLVERGCAVVTKGWSVFPGERGEDATRPTIEALYLARFDPVTRQPSEVSQTVTLVRTKADGEESRRSFTTTLTVVRPWQP